MSWVTPIPIFAPFVVEVSFSFFRCCSKLTKSSITKHYTQGDQFIAIVETERQGQIFHVCLNRPEKMCALGMELLQGLAEAFIEFDQDPDLEVAVLTGNGRAFCAGEDMKESLERGAPKSDASLADPFMTGTLQKPVIAAINRFAIGGGFMMVERTDLRVAVRGAVFEISEAKRWLLGGYNHLRLKWHLALGLQLAVFKKLAL